MISGDCSSRIAVRDAGQIYSMRLLHFACDACMHFLLLIFIITMTIP